MITKKFGVDFFTDVEQHSSLAVTLRPDEVCEDHNEQTGQYVRTHPDGWTISGWIVENGYYWVNEFEASHPQYGRVWGNFEEEVYADSEEGFSDFFSKHEVTIWDYDDI
jgi:hypothetical protein